VTTDVAGSVVEVEGLFVDPRVMRRGVGRSLIDDVVAAARGDKLTGVEVIANGHALAFYEAMGFVPAGIAATLFGPAARMRRALNGR
jgi:GNAT superfamily N-acetyltransferase